MNPFEVICINNKPIPGNYNGGDGLLHLLAEGKIYAVVYEMPMGYILSETQDAQNARFIAFDPLRFVKVSGVCEIEISEARCREEAEALDIEFAEILENA